MSGNGLQMQHRKRVHGLNNTARLHLTDPSQDETPTPLTKKMERTLRSKNLSFDSPIESARKNVQEFLQQLQTSTPKSLVDPQMKQPTATPRASNSEISKNVAHLKKQVLAPHGGNSGHVNVQPSVTKQKDLMKKFISRVTPSSIRASTKSSNSRVVDPEMQQTSRASIQVNLFGATKSKNDVKTTNARDSNILDIQDLPSNFVEQYNASAQNKIAVKKNPILIPTSNANTDELNSPQQSPSNHAEQCHANVNDRAEIRDNENEISEEFEYSDEDLEDESEIPNSLKRRGGNKNLRLEREVRAKKDTLENETFKPPINIPKDEKRAVGEWSNEFVREIGIMIRQEAPLNAQSWKHVNEESKEQMLNRLTGTFDVDMSQRHVRTTILGYMQRLYTNWRTQLHKHYLELGGGDIAKKSPPEDLSDRVDEWIWLCEKLWENEKWKARSEANKKNRSKVKFVHKSGSQSFAQKRHNMTNKETNVKPGAIEFFEAVFKNKNGWAAPIAEEMAIQMKAKKAESEINSGPEANDDEIVKEVYTKKSGVLVGQSRTYKSIPLKETRSTENQESPSYMQMQLQAAQEQIERQQAELDDANAKINFLYQHFASQLSPMN